MQVRCVVHAQDQTFDLSLLTLVDRSHTATVSLSVDDSAANAASFYINICRPVSRQDGVQCPLDAAVCRKDDAETFVVSWLDIIWLCLVAKLSVGKNIYYLIDYGYRTK